MITRKNNRPYSARKRDFEIIGNFSGTSRRGRCAPDGSFNLCAHEKTNITILIATQIAGDSHAPDNSALSSFSRFLLSLLPVHFRVHTRCAHRAAILPENRDAKIRRIQLYPCNSFERAENICFEVIYGGKGYAPPDTNNLFHRDGARTERGGGEGREGVKARGEDQREGEGVREKREEKRVNFTTRKMRVYRPVVRKGRRGESARSEAR